MFLLIYSISGFFCFLFSYITSISRQSIQFTLLRQCEPNRFLMTAYTSHQSTSYFQNSSYCFNKPIKLALHRLLNDLMFKYMHYSNHQHTFRIIPCFHSIRFNSRTIIIPQIIESQAVLFQVGYFKKPVLQHTKLPCI